MRTNTIRSIAMVSALVLATLDLVSCSRSKDGQVAQSSAQLLAARDDAGIGSTIVGTPVQEPSGDFVTDRAGGLSLVVGFNGGGGGQSWAVSTDLGHSFSRQCGFDGTSLLGDAGLSCTAVPIPNSPAIPTGADGGEVFGWSGDPTVRADGKGSFVYVSLANPTSDRAFGTLVAAAVSSNGGMSFDSSTIVNDIGCGHGGISQAVDQPNAVFDYTTEPPTLWVVFRNASAGTDTLVGACARRGIIQKAGGIASIVWLDQSRTVDGMGGSGFVLFPYTYGLGVAAGDGVLTVMYSAGTSLMPKSNTKNPGLNACPDDNPDLNGVAWATVDSFDNGNTWVDNTKIFHTEKAQWCVLQERLNTRGGSLKTVGQVLSGLRQFTIARAPGGIEYAVLQDTNSTARLFMSPAGGTKGRENANSTIRTWFEWCPGTPTSNVDGGPVSNWLSTGIGNGDETPCATSFISTSTPLLANDLVWPTIAVDGRGNIAVTDIEDVNPRTINYAIRGITNPQRPGALVQGPRFMSSTPFTLATSGFFRPMGDYGWLAVLPQGPMFRPPGCSVTNDFFPLWTANDGTGNPVIITRGFSLTPP